MGGYAWVTLATNDSYSLGALVLAHSLRRVGSQHDLVVLITPGVSQSMREKLISVFTLVREVNVLDSKDEANLEVLQRPELGITFTKLHCWRLTQYDKCVFIDADALVVKNCDELFEREELSAAPDVGWPDCFNSGVFVFKPSQQTFALLIQFAASHGSFDGADQGLLNMYFSDWAHKDISKHLPFIYNMCSVASYSYAPAFNVYGKNVRIVHFIGATKPWLQYFDTLTGIVQPPANCGHVQPLLQVWWNIFHNNVQSELSGEMADSNMRTLWHSSHSFSSKSNVYNNKTFLYISDQGTYDEVNNIQTDFSEFNDPWKNCTEHTDTVLNKSTKQIDVDEQYYCDIDKNCTELQLLSHNQRGAEPRPKLQASSKLSLSASYQSNRCDENYSLLQPSQIFQTLTQESVLLKCEVDQKFIQDNNVPQNLIEQHKSPTEKDAHFKQNLNNNKQLFPFSNITDYIDDQSLDNINLTDRKNDQTTNHINNKKEQTKFHLYIANRTSDIHGSRQSIRGRNDRDQKQTDMQLPSPLRNPAPSINPNNIEMNSDLSASSFLENANGGLAGTLSRLTIGEVRAEDQKAIEDHIRKQNWEQGQIDYMGKDSFDNILKKINETVELASLEKTSAVEEIQQPKKTGSKDSEVEAAVEKSEVVLPEIEDEAQSQKIQLPPDNGLTSTKNAEPQIESTSVTEVKETDGTNLQQTTISTQNIFDLIKSTDGFQITDQLTQTVTPSVVLLMPEVLDVKQAKSLKQNIDAESIQQVTETSPEAVINTTVSNISLSSILSESQSEKSDETVQINETLNLPETVTECPVPIQVAESVLQAEPKESVSENLKSTTDEVTSTISSLKKSAVADTDTLTELKQTDLNQCSSISPPLNSENNLLKTEENKNVTLLTLDTTLVASNSKIVSAAPEISQRTQEEIQSSEKSQLPSEVAAQIEEVPVQEAESVQETAKLVLPITPQCVEEITELPKVDSLAPKETPLPMQNTQTLVQEVQSVGVETGSALQETGLTSLEPQSGMQKMELTSQEKIPEPEDGSCIVKPDESISQKSKLTVKLPQPELSKEHNLTENKDLTTNLNRSFEGEILEKKDSKMTSPTEIDESLVESNTIKDIKVPGTPIVIEPTPPTSPPFEIKADQVTQEKTQEKTKKETEVEKQIEVSSTEATAAQEIEKLDHLKQESDSETTESAVKTEEKKSSAESDSPSSPEIEGTSKSIGNSNVKKVSKKPNESEEAKESSSIDKPTKIPKTAKKLTKTPSSTSLDADRSVPETPPPSGAATSQVPVPPKRKTKNNSSTKTSSKK